MTTPYTGKTPLKDALAELCGCSSKNHNKLAQLVNDALHGLGKTSKAKNKGVELNLAIYQWHVDRLHSVKINSQANDSRSVEIISQSDDNESVNIFSQPTCDDYVNINSQSTDNDSVEIISQDTSNDGVKINSQQTTETVETFSQYRIAFHTTTAAGRKRQVIALDGFYINALVEATGIDKKGIPAWIQRAVDNWTDFDAALPITRQVKYLLIRELTKQLKDVKRD